MTKPGLRFLRSSPSRSLLDRAEAAETGRGVGGRRRKKLLLGVSSAALLGLPLGWSTPATAVCSNNTPASNTTVTCDATAPNPDTQGVQAQPGSTNVTVTVDPGAAISHPSLGVTLGSQSSATNNGTINITGTNITEFEGAALGTSGANSVLTNNGTITSTTTSGGFGAMLGSGDSHVLTNSAGATITTSGGIAKGMQLVGAGLGSTAINNGTIITTGNGTGPINLLPAGIHAVGSGSIVINNGVIDTGGVLGIGIYANNGAGISITNTGSITTAGNLGSGIVMGGAASTLNNSGTVTTAGTGAFGLAIEGENHTVTNSGTITTAGADASGVFIGPRGGTIGGGGTMTNTGTITTTGPNAHGVFMNGGTNNLTNSGTIRTSGPTSFGISLVSFADAIASQVTSIVNQASGVIRSEQYTAIATTNGDETVDNAGTLIGGNGIAVSLGQGTDTLILRGASVVQGAMDGGAGGANGTRNDTLTFDGFAYTGGSQILNWETLSLTNSSVLMLDGNLVMGDSISLTGTVGIDGTSAINAFADRTIRAFDAASLVTVNNAGTLNLSNGTVGNALTIAGNYVGQGGRLVLDTVLAGDGAPSDKLVIDRGAATGSTSLVINNAGGAGAQTTGDGIKVVEAINGGTTAPGAFALAGRVAAGAFDYTLFRSGATTPEDWYLRSTRVDPGPGPGPGEIPNYRPEVPLDMALPNLAQEFGFAMLDTRQEHIGADIHDGYGLAQCDDPTRKFRYPASMPQKAPLRAEPSCPRYRVWARVFGETGRHKEGSFWSGHGPTYDYGLAGFQAGIELYLRENADGSRDILGAYLGAGRAEGDVEHVFGGPAGDISLDGYSAGAYWTHFGASGWYVDGVLQGTWFDQVKARSVAGQGIGTQGSGLAASLEGGYPISFGDRWVIEPQAQIIYQRVALDGTADNFGLVTFADSDASRARVGARLAKSFDISEGGRAPRLLTTYARANIWHGFGDDATTTFANLQGFNAVALTSDLRGTWAQIGGGLTGQVTEAVAVFASGDYNFSIDGGKSTSLGGRVGVKVVW
jgi:outer membrane autotransporter protein